MSPAALLGICWVASVAAAGWWAYGAGKDAEIASQAREDRYAAVAVQQAASATAAAISKIKVQHRTVRQEVEREIIERPVYRDPLCSHSPEQLQRINAAITGRAEPAGSGLVPPADAADRRQLRGDDDQAAGGRGDLP